MSNTADFYFAYGSNMDAAQVATRGLAVVERFSGILDGYRLVFNKRAKNQPGVAHANIERCDGAQVEGALYALKARGGIEAMDPFEGYPVRYDRTVMSIAATRGACEAWVYVANPAVIEGGLAPTADYLEHLLAGRDLLTPGYARMLEGVQVATRSDVKH